MTSSAKAPTNNVGAAERLHASQYVKLLLWRGGGKKDKYLIALRTTADFYGWTQEFEHWSPRMIYQSGGYEMCVDPGRRGNLVLASGRRHRVCRSPVKMGYPRGLTNQFKLSRNCGVLDIAEVAHFTKGEWHWMDTAYGERISRERWERIYQAGIPGQMGVIASAS